MIPVLINVRPDVMKLITEQMQKHAIDSLDEFFVSLLPKPKKVSPTRLFGDSRELKLPDEVWLFFAEVYQCRDSIPEIPLELGTIVEILSKRRPGKSKYSKKEKMSIGYHLARLSREGINPHPHLSIEKLPIPGIGKYIVRVKEKAQ